MQSDSYKNRRRLLLAVFLVILQCLLVVPLAWAGLSFEGCSNEFPSINGTPVYPAVLVAVADTKSFKKTGLSSSASNKFIGSKQEGGDVYFLCETYTPTPGSPEKSLFAIEFNAKRHIPDWVAYKLNSVRLTAYGNEQSDMGVKEKLTREGSGFGMNQTLVRLGIKQAIPFTYANNNVVLVKKTSGEKAEKKYHKGHLLPNSDALYTPEAQAATFTFVNAAPQ